MKSTGEVLLIGLALAAGAMLPLQALVNARLGAQLSAPLWAATLQNVLGAAAMGLMVLAMRVPAPDVAEVARAPVWTWAGGVLGATYVLIALLATPRLGATRAMVAIITGQLVASLLFDHFGVLQARREIDLRALAGVAVLGVGAWLILGRK
ncbi:MAG TPA: DMT family transporter [Caulobacteraceae bacterium]|nr:DMT family transporter [Caulobacteraceae bacterium]